jgi:hypothetical protein
MAKGGRLEAVPPLELGVVRARRTQSLRRRVRVSVAVVVVSSSSTVDELVIEPEVLVVAVVFVVEVLPERLDVLPLFVLLFMLPLFMLPELVSAIVLPELVVPLTVVELPLCVRLVSAVLLLVDDGFSTVAFQTGSVTVVFTVVCSVLGVSVL